MLQLFPEQDTAVVILLNSAKPGVLEDIARNLVSELIQVDNREPDPCLVMLDTTALQSYTGVFESFDAVYHIALNTPDLENDYSALSVSRTDKLHKTTSTFEWRPLGEHIFAVYTDQGLRLPNVVFMAVDNSDVPQQLFVGGRLNCRIGSPVSR